jgi:serine protease Do
MNAMGVEQEIEPEEIEPDQAETDAVVEKASAQAEFSEEAQASSGMGASPEPGDLGMDPADQYWLDEEAHVKKSRKGLRGIALFLVIVLVFSTGYGLGSGIAGLRAREIQEPYEVPATEVATTTVSLDRNPNLIVDIVDRVGPSIVAIQTEVASYDLFGNAQLGQSAGSGVIFDRRSDELLLLTNQHVIDGARSIQATFEDGLIVPAELMGSDSETDLAVLKLSRDDFENPSDFEKIEPVPFGNSSEVRTGEIAIAIGNPLGLGNSVTQGIVSSEQREISTNGVSTVSLIQTDAAINPGNSGGALLNGEGELIGINTIKIADEQVEGIGFAIPVNQAIPILEQLVENGEVARPYIGIIGESLGAERSASWGVPEGILLVRVLMDTPAREAGLQAGDIITEFDGVRVTTMEALLGQLYFKKVGDQVEVKGYRDDSEFSVTLELAQRADE